jgi:nitrite reductase (NADH) small subunit
MSAWRPVCRLEQLPVDRGVCALLGDRQVALFRTLDGNVYAIDNRDPFSGAMVLSRGIVGGRGDAATVASPMYKQAFDLASGACLDDPAVRIPVYPVQVQDGTVHVIVDPIEERLPA